MESSRADDRGPCRRTPHTPDNGRRHPKENERGNETRTQEAPAARISLSVAVTRRPCHPCSLTHSPSRPGALLCTTPVCTAPLRPAPVCTLAVRKVYAGCAQSVPSHSVRWLYARCTQSVRPKNSDLNENALKKSRGRVHPAYKTRKGAYNTRTCRAHSAYTSGVHARVGVNGSRRRGRGWGWGRGRASPCCRGTDDGDG